jgi:hypothetical protein
MSDFRKETSLFLKCNSGFLYPRDKKDKTIKIRLKLCTLDDRAATRIRSYYTIRRLELMNLKDSLNGPGSSFNPSSRFDYGEEDNLSYEDHINLIEKAADSNKKQVVASENPQVAFYYKMSDAINTLDSTQIYKLLSEGNYSFHYSQYFLKKLALRRPELLIRYIDKNPMDKDTILRAIKNHNEYRLITEKVKETNIKSKGEKEIVRQKTKRVIKEISTGALLATFVLGQFALLALAVVWIL